MTGGHYTQYYYTREHGSFYYYGGCGNLSFMTDRVAIAFDIGSGEHEMACMHKHGRPEQVQKWFDETVSKYHEAGHADMAQGLRIIYGTGM